MSMIRHSKIQLGTSIINISLEYKNGRIWITSPYNKDFISEIRAMEGSKWHGYDEENPIKKWSITDSERNEFALAYLEQRKPYARYRRPLDDIQIHLRPNLPKPPYAYQINLAKHMLRGWATIIAADMGVGKSLAAILAVETFFRNVLGADVPVPNTLCWYIGPSAGVIAFERELLKWNSPLRPRLLTYEENVRELSRWISGNSPPQVVIFDESSKIKNYTAQRSKAAIHLSKAIREKYTQGIDPYGHILTGPPYLIIEMSGTPAPKDPIDIWHQAEVACPGYIKEGHPAKLRTRLSLVKQMPGLGGVSYPKVITWFDDPKKCKVCGMFADDPVHSPANQVNESYHHYQQSENEVKAFGQRLDGLMTTLFKKDCLNLPPKIYDPVRLKPTIEMIRASKLIIASSPRAIQALTLLRELSDGFQYTTEMTGTEKCDGCNGTHKISLDNVTYDCPACDENGNVPIYKRDTSTFPTPKDDAFVGALDEMEDTGRLVAWGAFTATIDKLTSMYREYGWYVLRVDKRGFCGFKPDGSVCDPKELLDALDGSHPRRSDLENKYPKLGFVGQAQSGGMALTLTASPLAIYYSNAYVGEARMQSEDRIHRAGMDENRAAIIRDLLCLPVDRMVLDNLNDKRWLQNLTLGDLKQVMENV